MLQTLFLYSLLPPRMLQMEDFLGGVSRIPMAVRKSQQPTPRLDGGILSALSSYLMTPYGASTDSLIEATPEEIEKTMCAVDCIAACRLDELYSQIMCVLLAFLHRYLMIYQGNYNWSLCSQRSVLYKTRPISELCIDSKSSRMKRFLYQ